jgi:nickel-dependent lactate racemase
LRIALGYGKKNIDIEVPDVHLQDVLRPNIVEFTLVGEAAVKDALEHPISSPRLKDIVKRGEKVSIITSDITRPMPSETVLPHLLNELYEAGCRNENILIVFALGIHRPHTESEKRQIVGDEIYEKIKCVDSDHDDIIYLGDTMLGTPVEVFRPVAEADRVICLGNIEYHYFAGYSGGAKAIMPGVSTGKAIQANHRRMVEATSVTGEIDNNNVRLDIEQAAELLHIDFLLNVVLNEKKQIIKAVAGHYKEAHRVGCAFLDALYKTPIQAKADIVVVSAGGFPKDINLYQAQKALDNSKHAVKDGGTIILLAECIEGLGENVFERWILEATSPKNMVEKIKSNFELGGHKAAAIGMVQMCACVVLISSMPSDFVKKIFFESYSDIQSAIDDAVAIHGPDCRVIVMPFGGSTLPVYKENKKA